MLFLYFNLTSLTFLSLLCFRWFYYLGFRRRLMHFDKLSATRCRMLCKPPILLARWPIVCSFDNAIEWLLLNAYTAITKPDMLSSLIYFIGKSMINGESEPCCFINFIHFGYKVRPMTISSNITRLLILSHEQKGMYELM